VADASASRPRVLHLIPSLGGAGAERQLAYLAGGLVRQGVDVQVGYLEGGPNLERLARSGAGLHRIPSRSSYDPALPLRVLGLVRRAAPAIVQTWLPMMDVLGGAAARLAGVPWILSERNTSSEFPPAWKLRVRARLARGAAAIVSNSESGDRDWAERLPAVRRAVVRNALDLEAIERAPAVPATVPGLPEGPPLVLAVGKFKPQKNVWNLLDALERLLSRSAACALVCGEGELHAEAIRRLRERGLGNRLLAPGFVGDVWSWMKRARVFVSVSHYEGMPNAVMEAMACGCPLVLSDIPMHREIVEPGAALFVDPERPDEIADALAAVLADPDAARARAEVARKAALAWSIDAAAARYAELYAAVAAGRAPR
jgi:glycosyltransferase involved in cell wall biosynthesis